VTWGEVTKRWYSQSFVGSTLEAGTDSPKKPTHRGDTQHFGFAVVRTKHV